MAAATASGFEGALTRLAEGSPFMPMVFESPRSAWGHHLGEYAAHTEDVVRANALPPTMVDGVTADALWRRARVAARRLHRRSGGLVLERADTGAVARVLPGASTRHVVGVPLDLLVWAHRGAGPAGVRVIG